MAKHFTLAVWTATMAYNARRIVNDLFTVNGIPLLFAWYNDSCVAVYRADLTVQPPVQAVELATTAAASEDNKDGNQVSSPSECPKIVSVPVPVPADIFNDSTPLPSGTSPFI